MPNPWSLELWQAMRNMKTERLFSLASIANVTLGLGISAAAFAFADGYLFRPLPYAYSDQLFFVQVTNRRPEMLRRSELQALRESELHTIGFAEWRVSRRATGDLLVSGRRIEVVGYEITPAFRNVVNLPLTAGRDFVATDHINPDTLVAWLGHHFWRREFGSDQTVMGKTFELEAAAERLRVQVVGVLGPETTSLDSNNRPPDLVVPATHPETLSPSSLAMPIVRLPSGMTREQGEALITNSLYAITPGSDRMGQRVGLRPLVDYLTAGGKPTARLILTGAILVLALSMVNVAYLALTRSRSRQREIALRVALGASRWCLLRLVVIENVVVGVTGLFFGLALGASLAGVIAARVPMLPTASRNLALAPMLFDWRVVAFVTALVVPIILSAAAAGFSVLCRSELRPDRIHVATRIPRRLASRVLASELAIATVLVIEMSVIGHGIWQYLHQPIGFDFVDRFRVSLMTAGPERPSANDRATAAAILRSIPAVRVVGSYQPDRLLGIEVPGRPIDADAVTGRSVDEGYFSSWNIPLRAGRWFTPDEFKMHASVAIVDSRFAQLAWPFEDPIGRDIRLGSGTHYRVVGVVASRLWSLARVSTPEAFIPTNNPSGSTLVAWAPNVNVVDLEQQVVRAIRAASPHLSARVSPITFESLFLRDISEPLFLFPIVSVFGLLALMLAAVGVFGLVSYVVAQGTREFGIQLALGATTVDVLLQVLKQGVRPSSIGIAVGTPAAWGIHRVVESTAFGWPTQTWIAVGISIAVLFGVAIAAAFVPAWTAMRVNPMNTLRAE